MSAISKTTPNRVAPSSSRLTPQGLDNLKAILCALEETSTQLQKERNETVSIMMRALMTPEQSAKFEAKLAVIDVQLKALKAEKARIDRLMTTA